MPGIATGWGIVFPFISLGAGLVIIYAIIRLEIEKRRRKREGK
ncbi:MAG: hypothetical protein NWF14_06205 [Candidatus Bathyarchaeota archaeon]|nr:hypothetical protein [Candidatus Bathyarchaeota archaeon]